MTKTEMLLIEARDIAHRILGADVSNEVIGQVFDSLTVERMSDGEQLLDAQARTMH